MTSIDPTGRRAARRFSLAGSRLVLALAGMSLLAIGPASPAQEPGEALQTRAMNQAQATGQDDRLIQATLPGPGRCIAPPPDMDAWYPFDGNGNDLILGKNATAVGPVAYPNAVVQRGGRLNTSASYFSIAAGPVLNQGLGDFSIDMWLFVPSHWLPGPHPVRTLVEKRTNVGGYRGYSLFVYNSRLGLQLADGGFTNFGQPAASSPLTAGWNHIAVTVDRDNPKGIVFYRNGAILGTENPTGRQGNLDNTAPTLIGRNAFGHGGTGEKAIFDEIEFFDRVLQPGEVKAIFAAGKAGKCKP
ncbi:MAG TPA: LamG-like jellyroll fold domain-containing protein [Allosphingosinicella sp.]|nr:LamG-like jellyroll fold domain-containing protein [Allosphingosinicella sp.]